jgi:ankyrin repeat protein
MDDKLQLASIDGKLDDVKQLLEEGTNVNARDKNGWCPIHHASQFGHVDVVKLLLEKGADVDASHKYGTTPLNCTYRNPSVNTT